MNWLNIHTEYSFREVFGPLDKILDALPGATALGIADFNNTFGHVPWAKACAKRGIKPVFGVVLGVVSDPAARDKMIGARTTFVALTTDGLREIYELVKRAHAPDRFYYHPRIGYDDLNQLSSAVAVLGHARLDASKIQRPTHTLLAAGSIASLRTSGRPFCGGQDNLMVGVGDRAVYELLCGRNATNRTSSLHILDQDEWALTVPEPEWEAEALANQATILELAAADIPSAPMVRAHTDGYSAQQTLEDMCWCGYHKVDLGDPVYHARLTRELAMIKEKDFADYFLIVSDMVRYAKQHMFVGPSRGSAAGSLVCYLTDITEIDPIEHGLLFERFIDVTRKDLPDIDLDFPDSKRHMVLEYLKEKYGRSNVAQLGTVLTLQAKSAITEFAKQLQVPPYATNEVKTAIIERSSGDARAAQCIQDTFESTDAGKRFISKYPQMALVSFVEDHARAGGTHAAGVIVCNQPVTNYAGIGRDDVAMITKDDAEKINLLKIDVLGLRTLSILEETLTDLGKDYNWLYTLPLNDGEAFAVFNRSEYAGIFQFEGYALQSLTRQMGIHNFYDIAAINALSRPGPLHSGGATLFIARRTGREPVTYWNDHPSVVDNTKDEYGIIIYQEQVMQIGRHFGGLSWEDVSELRKAMSKSYGEEFFNKYRERFLSGTKAKGIKEEDADVVWKNMVTFGSWGFNKSHAVGYALLSYWCAYLKAHHPLEFAKANLNNVRDKDSAIKLLREFKFPHIAVDPERSTERWTVENGTLIGPLTNVFGIGPAISSAIMAARAKGEPLTNQQLKLLSKGAPEFEELYPAQKLWGDYYKHPERVRVRRDLNYIKDIQHNGTYVFLGKLVDRNLRDLNEYGNVVKRGGQLMTGPTLFLNFTLEDDTDSIICTIGRYKFQQYGKSIAESGKIGEDWFLVYGEIKNEWRKIYVIKIEKLEDRRLLAEQIPGSVQLAAQN